MPSGLCKEFLIVRSWIVDYIAILHMVLSKMIIVLPTKKSSLEIKLCCCGGRSKHKDGKAEKNKFFSVECFLLPLSIIKLMFKIQSKKIAVAILLIINVSIQPIIL